MQGSPVTSALLRHAADALNAGEPAWWKRLEKAWQKRTFTAWTEAWTLLMAAVHHDALGDAKNPLVPYFPSCGGTAEADPSTVFARYLADAPDSVFERLKSGQRRVFEPNRAKLWMTPAAAYFQRRKMPYYVVQVNAGSGLDLAIDLLYPQPAFGSSLIAARIGLDPAPLDLSDIDHRRWQTAALMPEELAAIAELDRCTEVLLDRQRREPNFVQLASCPTEKAPAFIVKNIPPDDPDVGLLVLNMGVTVRMTDAEYRKFHAQMAEALAPWTGRALWFEVEHVRGEVYSTTYQALIHKPAGGEFEEHTMLRLDFASQKVSFDAAAVQAFLAK